MELDDVMLIGEAAAFLNVCPKTLRNWHKSGKLVPSVNPLTNFRFYRKKDLELFAENNKKRSKSQ